MSNFGMGGFGGGNMLNRLNGMGMNRMGGGMPPPNFTNPLQRLGPLNPPIDRFSNMQKPGAANGAGFGLGTDAFGPPGNLQAGGSSGAGGVGYNGPAMGANLQSGQVPSLTPQALMGPRNGTWLDDYRNAGTQDGVPLGFTGTRNGRNYINGNPYAAEYMSQGNDPNAPSYAFGNILRQYGLLR